MAATGSTCEQPQFIASAGNRSCSNVPLIENSDTDRIVVPDVSLIHSCHILSTCFDLCISSLFIAQFIGIWEVCL